MKSPTIKFVFEDEFLFVLEKPALLHSVKINSSKDDSLAARLLDENPQLSEVAAKPEDAGLLQRLDYETSGLILGAKNKQAWSKLKDCLKQEKIKKSYFVLVEGAFPKMREAVGYIGSRHRASKRVTVTKFPVARSLQARTTFELIKKIPRANASMLKAFAENARRHQVRAQAAQLGFPLLGDKLYGSKRTLDESLEIQESALPVPPFLLHADFLSFTHPLTDQKLSFRSKPPEYFPDF